MNPIGQKSQPVRKPNPRLRCSHQRLLVVCPAWNTGSGVEATIRAPTCRNTVQTGPACSASRSQGMTWELWRYDEVVRAMARNSFCAQHATARMILSCLNAPAMRLPVPVIRNNRSASHVASVPPATANCSPPCPGLQAPQYTLLNSYCLMVKHLP